MINFLEIDLDHSNVCLECSVERRASFRNIMLVTLGASAAAEKRATHVAVTVSKEQESRSEDAVLSFLRHAEALLHALEL